MLDNLYRSDTEKLSRLLNDEQYLWKGAGNDSGIVGDTTEKHRRYFQLPTNQNEQIEFID